MTPTHLIHHAAAEGYQANADRYVKGRPDYRKSPSGCVKLSACTPA
ncbi:hypothetical protein J4732_16230 [Serratia marcescens]|uniref:Uncharacterized protein n=1 Tax=Serratia marcescens TaxID=615 RepID=A0A939SNX1_SERMA|nr:hypothetical protein [Serratia marcescens]